ncbi:MAG TPA: hypothetical protein VFZ34_30290 [Blastocatellia bacterium]|nr:hypothetical protein [Blastocatellia bacterium]
MNEQLLTRYLLGELSEDEQTTIEEQLFTNDELFQQARALKAELTDNYVRGNLSASERLRYEQRFLTSPVGRNEALFARAFTQVLAEEEPVVSRAAAVMETKPSPWEAIRAFFRMPALGVGLAMASLLLLLGGFWLYQQSQRWRTEVQQANTARDAEARRQKELQDEIARARARNEELNQQLQQAQQERDQARQALEKAAGQPTPQTAPNNPNSLLSVLLVPSLLRGDNQRARITIPASTGRLQMQLDLDQSEQYQSYRAELRTKRGQLLHRQSKLVPRVTAAGKAVFLVVPAANIRNGDYDITLFGVTASGAVEEANFYHFTAVRR